MPTMEKKVSRIYLKKYREFELTDPVIEKKKVFFFPPVRLKKTTHTQDISRQICFEMHVILTTVQCVPNS